MSTDPNKWINTISQIKKDDNLENYNLNPDKWTDTIPKKTKKNSVAKYSISIFLFVTGLVLVSAIKNESKILQKEINNLYASINTLKYNLHQASLDHEVITSPENISKMAAEYLEKNLVSYKKKQIKNLNIKEENPTKEEKNTSNKINKKLKIEIAKKINEKKLQLKKLKKISLKPEKLPMEIKTKIDKKISSTKQDIEKLYSDPKSVLTPEKMQSWAALQVVKLFLGMPIVPGR